MRIVIIGTNHGLGLCLARVFANAGHEVLAGYLGQSVPSELQALIRASENRVAAVPTDVTKEIQILQAAAFTKERWGKADALVHVAGVILPSDRINTIEHADLDDLRRTLTSTPLAPSHPSNTSPPSCPPTRPF